MKALFGYDILALFGLVALFGVLLALKNGVAKEQVWLLWTKVRVAFIAGLLGMGVLWLGLALLWGFEVAAGGMLLASVVFCSYAVLGRFGGQWVGAVAAELERSDQQMGQIMFVPALVWLVIGILFGATWSFSGFCAWRPFG